MVEGIGPAQHLVQHAVLQHRARGRRDAAGVRGAVDLARARPQVRRHATAASTASTPEYPPSALLLHRMVHRRRRHRQLDRGPLRRLARAAPGGHGVARRSLQQAALLLSLRSAVLFAAARLSSGGDDRLHPGLLDGGARLATALQDAGPARCARTGPEPFQARGRAGIAVSARRRGGAAAGLRL